MISFSKSFGLIDHSVTEFVTTTSNPYINEYFDPSSLSMFLRSSHSYRYYETITSMSSFLLPILSSFCTFFILQTTSVIRMIYFHFLIMRFSLHHLPPFPLVNRKDFHTSFTIVKRFSFPIFICVCVCVCHCICVTGRVLT